VLGLDVGLRGDALTRAIELRIRGITGLLERAYTPCPCPLPHLRLRGRRRPGECPKSSCPRRGGECAFTGEHAPAVAHSLDIAHSWNDMRSDRKHRSGENLDDHPPGGIRSRRLFQDARFVISVVVVDAECFSAET
jgi:hypothetical protein